MLACLLANADRWQWLALWILGTASARSWTKALDPFLNVVRTLAGSELNDAKIGETELEERILLDDGLDVGSTLSHRQDDPAISRYLSTREQEVSGSVVLLQEVILCCS